MAYSNGRLPDSALVAVSGVVGARMRPGAAAAWETLRQAVHAAYGWWPTQTGPADAYRPYSVQEAIFRARYTTSYLAGRPTKRWNGRVWYLLPGKATAATPGTSNHGLGITVDITGLGGFTGARYKQLAEHAIPLGWSNAEGRSIGEAWHWTYTGPADATSNVDSNAGRVPVAPTLPSVDPLTRLMEEPMPVRIRQSNGAITYVDLTRGNFRTLDATANSIVDKLDVPIVWDGLDTTQRNQVRQLVLDLAQPKIDA